MTGVGLTFAVDGTPVAQGSVRAFMPKGAAQPVIVHDNKAVLRTWRGEMRAAAKEAMGDVPPPYFGGAVAIRLTFAMPRPASVTRDYPEVKPDLDKLVRAALDAFTEAGVWVDDARVVQILTSKVYKARPGVLVDIRAVV